MKKLAILAYVEKTLLNGYSNEATEGVARVASYIRDEIKPLFGNDLIDLGPLTTRESILEQLAYAASHLDNDGSCFFYFHGHGDSLPGKGYNDEPTDEVLVCHNDYLFDDEIDAAFRKFKRTQRIFTLVDSCSSETVIEWNRTTHYSYPEILHIASSKDEDVAYANLRGGLFSTMVYNKIYYGNYHQLTYQSLCTYLEVNSFAIPCYLSKHNVSSAFLDARLFT